MFDCPPVGGEEGSGDIVRELVGNRNYRRRPARGEGSDRHLAEHQRLDVAGPVRRLIRRMRRALS